MNPNGDIIVDTTYGNAVVLFNGQTGAQTTLAGFSNPGSVAADPQGNVFVGFQYGNQLLKIPYANGQYAAVTSTTTFPSVNCNGSDTAPCMMANVTQGNVISMVFDAKGDLYYATNNGSGSNPNAIWECTAACLYSGSPAPVMLYMEPASSAPATAGQLEIGGIGVDPWGNLFFADSLVLTGNSANVLANLNELTTSSSAGFGGKTTGYAAAPTVLYTLTDASPAQYDDDLGSVAVDSSGTVYFAMLYDGIYAIPNNGGTIAISGGKPVQMYSVSFQGAKILGVDGKGNLYDVSNNNVKPSGDDVMRIAINNVTAPPSPVGTPVTVPTAASTPPANTPNGVYAALNDSSDCSAVLTVTAAEGGVATSEFSGSGGTCASLKTGVSFPLAFTFTPVAVGRRNAFVTVTDGTNSGLAVAAGVGQGFLANLDPGVATIYSTGFSSPSSVVADAAGDVFVADGSLGKVFEISAGSTTLNSVGSFTTPAALALDANGNLFIADRGVPALYEIPNKGTTGAFVAGTQSTVVASSTAIGGTPLGDPVGLAVGPDGVVYIADSTNSRVVTYNPLTGATGVTAATAASGLKTPAGLAVDASGNLYIADDSLNQVFIFAGDKISTLAPSSVKETEGVAVDASGSVLIADKSTGNIVRVPLSSGTLDTSKAILIEKNPQSAQSIWLDAAGNLYTADSAAKAVFAIHRTAAAIDIGTVQDGLTNTGTVYLMNAGNAICNPRHAGRDSTSEHHVHARCSLYKRMHGRNPRSGRSIMPVDCYVRAARRHT